MTIDASLPSCFNLVSALDMKRDCCVRVCYQTQRLQQTTQSVVSQSDITSSSVVKRSIVVQETQAGSQRVLRDGDVVGLRFVDSKKERIMDQSTSHVSDGYQFLCGAERGPGCVSVA